MKKYSFTPFPVMTTERLIIRMLVPEDALDIYKMKSNEDVVKYTGIKKYESVKEAKAYIEKINTGIKENKWILWGLELKEEKKIIGTICFWNINSELEKAEIGFEMLPKYQGKGYMQEALVEIIKYGFIDLSFNVIQALPHENNEKSKKILLKNDFTYMGYLKGEGLSEEEKCLIIYERRR